MSRRARSVLAAALVALPALIFYGHTLMPDVGFWDTAEFQAIGPVLGIAHPTGYPSYTLLAWLSSVVLQPFGNEALRANLLSAVLVAAGCGAVAATVTYLTGRMVAGVGSGIVLALCIEAWSIALHADPHALHLFLAAAILLLLVVWGEKVRSGQAAGRWLVAAAALFGVSLGNHGLTLLTAPGIALYVIATQPGIVLRARLIGACVAALAATTAALYLYLPLRSAMNPPLDYGNPQTWDGFRYVVFAEQFRGTFRPLPGLASALQTIVADNWQQLGLVFVLAGVGLVYAILRRPALVLMLGLWFAVNWWFSLGYVNADIGRYYLVPLMAVAVLGGLGSAALLGFARRAFIRPVGRDRRRPRRLAVAVVAALVLLGPPLAAVGDRLPRVDQSDDRVARTWLEQMGQLPPNAVVVSWWSYSTTLWYAQYVEGWRPDITVIDDRTLIDQGLGTVDDVLADYVGRRPLYLIRLASDLPEYEARWELAMVEEVRGGPVFEVIGPTVLGGRERPWSGPNL